MRSLPPAIEANRLDDFDADDDDDDASDDLESESAASPMSGEERDPQIAQLMDRAKSLRQQMEAPYCLCLDAVGKCLATRFEGIVGGMVVGQAKVTKRIGQGGLTQLRHGLDNLLAKLPVLVEEKIGAKVTYWPHKLSTTAELKRAYDDTLPIFLYDSMTSLMELVGELLSSSGYEIQEHAEWRFGDGFQGEIPFSEELQAAIDGYFTLQVELINTLARLNSLIRARDAEEAARAWSLTKPPDAVEPTSIGDPVYPAAIPLGIPARTPQPPAPPETRPSHLQTGTQPSGSAAMGWFWLILILGSALLVLAWLALC